MVLGVHPVDELLATLNRMRDLLDDVRGDLDLWVLHRDQYFDLAARMHELSNEVGPP